MIIQHNITALNANRMLNSNNSAVSKSLEKLSSGYKINRAADDAAGLAISEKMRAQITGLERAESNAQDGISLVQTGEGALTEVHDMLNRMVDLTTQSANGTLTDEDRTKIVDEMTSLKSEIDRVSESTNFNGIKLLDGSLASGATSTSVVGSAVKTYTAAKSAETSYASGAGIDFADKTTFVIDGSAVTVDWSKMSGDDKALLMTNWAADPGTTTDARNAAATVMQDAINGAIKDSGANVKDVTVKAGTTGFYVESGLTGSAKSEVTINKGTAADDASVAITLLGGAVSTGTDVSVKATSQTSDVSLAATAGTDSFYAVINGQKVQTTLSAPIVSGTTTMSAAATSLQTGIQTAIGVYNTQTGSSLTASDFTVKLTDNGGFEVVNKSGASLSFVDADGKTNAKKLGLTDAANAVSGNALTLQVGETSDSYQKVSVSVGDMSTKGLGISDVEVTAQGMTDGALDKIKAAINTVSTNRSALGALQNRLEHTINSLGVTNENITAAESRIRDTDMAKEMMAYTKNNVLTQAAQSMLAQANQAPQSVLQLLK